MKYCLTISAIWIAGMNVLFAQTRSDSPHAGLLVMYNPEISPNDIRTREIFRQNSGVRIVEYFEHLGVWHLVYETDRRSEEEALAQFRSEPGVLNVNPVRGNVTLRSAVPNDTHFASQWSLHNTGQTGGTSGVDIKALNAWEITKGNSWGTHVPAIAVIDDGFQQNHPDLGFLSGGYNAYDDSYTVPVASHGTHVSGILGARGNNTTGIAGINWTTNIFPVAGASTNETVVLRAYNHVLGLRKLYNSTGGASGHYIVATNSSFGVDFGDPGDYIGWCSSYDSLGVHGIVSVAATANDNINVDSVGDVPTGCSSNYLISVTNTTHTDTRNTSPGAAWGATSVDLGAPGTGILSTITSSSYASYTGTSMASPHVAGVVGLIYSTLSDASIANSLTNPSALPLQVKDWVLNNVDAIGALSGITATEGRLNAYKAVKAALPAFSNHTYSSNTTLGYGHLTGSNSVSNGVTLTISSGKTVILDGSLAGQGSGAELQVNGKLIVYANRSLSNLKITVASGGELIVRDNVSIDMGARFLTLNGQARFGSGVTVSDAIISVGSTGEVAFTGPAALTFIEIPAFPPFSYVPVFSSSGRLTFTNTGTVSMTLSANSAWPNWNGLQLSGSGANGSVVKNVDIHDTDVGVSLSSVSGVVLENITITAPTVSGVTTSAANASLINVTVDSPADYGFDLAGGYPELVNAVVTGSPEWGVYVHSGASTDVAEGSTAGTESGVYVSGASHWQINGLITASNPKATAVSSSYAYFNGTSWNGSPSSYADGTSTIHIYNPNNPVKARPDLEIPALRRELSERLRGGVDEAVVWAESELRATGGESGDVLALFLADQYLAAGRLDAAEGVLDGLAIPATPDAALRRVLLDLERGSPAGGRTGSDLDLLRASAFPSYRVEQLSRRLRDAGMPDEPMRADATDDESFSLTAHPNPFNPTTRIAWFVRDEQTRIRLAVYDILGREIAVLADGVYPRGNHFAVFDGRGLASGLYIYRITGAGRSASGTMMMVK